MKQFTKHAFCPFQFENMVPQCRVCSKSFGMLRSRNHCTFCSVALCSGCLYKDVILFANGTASVVHIAVIKVVGVRHFSEY